MSTVARVGRGGPLGRERRVQRPAQHRRHQRLLGLAGGRHGLHQTAVAQDRHLVGQLEHLAQEVRDEHDRGAVRSPAA